MDKQKYKLLKKKRRQKRVRSVISGTAQRPRLSVFKSNRGMYLQLIDDSKGITIASAHSREIKAKKGATKTALAQELGKLIAEKAVAKKIESVVFDRSGYRYHGRVKAVAEGARENGLKF